MKALLETCVLAPCGSTTSSRNGAVVLSPDVDGILSAVLLSEYLGRGTKSRPRSSGRTTVGTPGR